MPQFDASLGVFDDPEFADPLVHQPLVNNIGGEPTFATGRGTKAVVATPTAEDFEVTPIGQNDDLAFVLIAPRNGGFGDDDRVWYDPGLRDGAQPFRLTAPRPYHPFVEDAYTKWAMIQDRRGEGDDGTGGDPSEDTDPDPGSDGSDPTDDTGGSDGDGSSDDEDDIPAFE